MPKAQMSMGQQFGGKNPEGPLRNRLHSGKETASFWRSKRRVRLFLKR